MSTQERRELADELLPCPFCEGDAYARITGTGNWHYVECDRCEVQTTLHESRELAIAAWDRRPDAAALADIRALRMELGKAIEMLCAKGGRWVNSSEFDIPRIAQERACRTNWRTVESFGFIWQPVESGQREPSDQQLVAAVVEAAFAAGAYRGDGDLPDDLANAVTVAESALLARLAGGQNS
jgi:hypothetical protein